MDVDNIASAASAMARQQTGDAVGVLVLKKALQTQANGAIALINALPQPVTPSLPLHLGNHVNTTA